MTESAPQAVIEGDDKPNPETGAETNNINPVEELRIGDLSSKGMIAIIEGDDNSVI